MNHLHSVSGNCPPRHAKRLSDVLNEAYLTTPTSYARAEKTEDKSDHEQQQSEPPQPQAVKPLQSAQTRNGPPPHPQPQAPGPGPTDSSAVYPPQPCERCVRSKKVCKGVAGGRCDNCKALHQKCSNSSGPPRGRHATNSVGIPAVSEAGPSSWATRPKRKSVSKGKLVEEDDDDPDDESDQADLRQQPAQKKRRTSANNERRSRLLKEVTELESSIKRLQATFVKDLNKLQQTAVSLASQIRELD